MSHVADIILITAIDDGLGWRPAGSTNAEILSAYLSDRYNGATLKQVDDFAGGNKQMQCDVFMAAINALDIGGLVHAFLSADWESPESALLMIKDENDEAFTFHRPPMP